MSTRTVAVMMDALGKAAQMLEVPRKGLWPLIPGVTNGMLDDWEDLHEQQVEDDIARDPRMQQVKAAAGQKAPANVAQTRPPRGNGNGS